MNLSKVDALLRKMERHRGELYNLNFAEEIADFNELELQALSADMNRAINYRHLSDIVEARSPEALSLRN